MVRYGSVAEQCHMQQRTAVALTVRSRFCTWITVQLVKSALRHWNCEWLVMVLAHSARNTTQQRTAAISHAATQDAADVTITVQLKTADAARDPGMVGMFYLLSNA
jgi:hypothetical protein